MCARSLQARLERLFSRPTARTLHALWHSQLFVCHTSTALCVQFPLPSNKCIGDIFVGVNSSSLAYEFGMKLLAFDSLLFAKACWHLNFEARRRRGYIDMESIRQYGHLSRSNFSPRHSCKMDLELSSSAGAVRLECKQIAFSGCPQCIEIANIWQAWHQKCLQAHRDTLGHCAPHSSIFLEIP